MAADWKPPGILRTKWVEWKAHRYHDPIEKLACLRRNTKAATGNGSYWKLSLFALLLLLPFKMQTVTDARPEMARGKQESMIIHEPAAEPELQRDSTVPTRVWRVEHGPDYEVYSNGLRVDTHLCVPNEPRKYVIFHSTALTHTEWRTKPAGIVFHTTENVQPPFLAEKNATIVRVGQQLLTYVRRKHSYHFVIDRFGRVYRLVPETDVANHAGYSVWEDEDGIYLNLNHSFLGVSFDAQTRPIDEGYYLSPAQIRSGRLLVEMLVSKYGIPLADCVTHAQVSVDPETMVIGHHIDGSGEFPYKELGLPDNYSLPVPSIFAFGFEYDPEFLMSSGPQMWKGLITADERFRQEAKAQHLLPSQYREMLRDFSHRP
jgi:hypothetical protein